MTFKYVQKELTPQQKKKKAKADAAAKLNKEKEEAAKIEAEKDRLIQLEKQREAKRKEEEAFRIKMEARDKARKEKPAQFPEGFDDSLAKFLIGRVDFSDPDFVEEVASDTGTVTRTALVHYVNTDEYMDDYFHYDCWVGANAHPDDKVDGGWAPGNSWILEYRHGFSVKTSDKNVAIIKGLPKAKGTRPDVY